MPAHQPDPRGHGRVERTRGHATGGSHWRQYGAPTSAERRNEPDSSWWVGLDRPAFLTKMHARFPAPERG